MENSVEDSDSIQELNRALEERYERERIKRQKDQKSYTQVVIANENNATSQKIAEDFAQIEEIMQTIEEFEEDIFNLRSPNILDMYNQIVQNYDEIKDKLIWNQMPLDMNALICLKWLKNDAQQALASIIKGTQFHVILLDATPSLNKGKQMCSQLLSAIPQSNVLIQYWELSKYNNIFQKYSQLPSIYVFISEEPAEYLQFKNSLQRYHHEHKKLALQFFILSNTLKKSDIEQFISCQSYNIVSRLEELCVKVKIELGKFSKQCIQQILPVSEKQIMSNLEFMDKLSNLNYEQSVEALLQFKELICNTSEQEIVEKTNGNYISMEFYKSMKSDFFDLHENNQVESLSKRIFQNFQKYKSYFNLLIELNDKGLIDELKDLISAVVLAFNIIKDHELEKIMDKTMLKMGITISHEDYRRCFSNGKRIILPRFTSFRLDETKAKKEFTLKKATDIDILLVCMYEIDWPNRFQCLSVIDSEDIIFTSLPNTEFEIVEQCITGDQICVIIKTVKPNHQELI